MGLRNLKNNVQEQLANTKQHEKIFISQDNLQPLWISVVDKLYNRKIISKSMLMDSAFEIPNENLIEIFAQASVLDYLKNERLFLLDIFKTHYHNEQINIIISEKKVENNTTNYVLSTREIFEEMAQRNHYLKILKDKLGLDFER